MKKQRVNSTGSDETRSATVPPRLPSRLDGRLAAYVVAAEDVRSVHLARIQAGLSEGLNSRLVACAVAAGAAGLLLTSELAIADIIFTPANIGLFPPTNFSTQTRNTNTLAIDVDRDSIPEFKFVNSATCL